MKKEKGEKEREKKENWTENLSPTGGKIARKMVK